MAEKPSVSRKLPPGTQVAARMVWDSLSPADRKAIQDVVEAFPSQTNMIQLLLRLSTSQVKMAFGNKSRVAIIGPTNVGKSTLYNQLVARKEDKAAVSPLPGTTRQNQLADAGLFQIVDTPGTDAVGDSGEREQEQAMTAAVNADFLIIMFDAVQGIKRTELELYDQLVALGKPYVVVLNKIDMVRRERSEVIQGAAQSLRLEPDQVIPITAKTGEGMNDVLIAIAVTEPEIVAALGKAMPQFRWQLAWRAIVSAASASAVVALTPLPVVDFIPLAAIQSTMVLAVARIYDYDITFQRARELVVTFGLGFLGRMIFQELSRLGGVPGWVLGAAIAASTTVVMGYAASVWFETGERLSNDALKHLTRELTATLLNTLRNMGSRKPGKQSLKDQLEQILENMPIGRDRSNLDEQVQKVETKPQPSNGSGPEIPPIQ